MTCRYFGAGHRPTKFLSTSGSGTVADGSTVALQTLLGGQYVSVRNGGGSDVTATASALRFWWAGRGGASGTRKLWQITYDYLVNTKGLDNLIWVWNVQDFVTLSADVAAYNPGTAYFDIAALDVYNTGYTVSNYNVMLSAAGGKPIAIGECQFIPSASLLASQPQWTYFMLWPDFITEARNLAAYAGVFGAANVLTESELPGWK